MSISSLTSKWAQNILKSKDGLIFSSNNFGGELKNSEYPLDSKMTFSLYFYLNMAILQEFNKKLLFRSVLN